MNRTVSVAVNEPESVTVKVMVAAPPDQAIDVEMVVAGHVEADLPGLVTDLPAGGLMNVCSAKTAGTQVQDEHPSRKQLEELGVIDDDE